MIKTRCVNYTMCKRTKEEERERKKMYWHKPEVKFNTNIRIAKYKREAIRRGKTYILDDEFARLMLTSPCHYCGYLDLTEKLNGIDRVNNEIGYIQENCVPCCEICNFGKGKKSEQQFIEMCRRVVDHQKNIGN